MPEYGAMAAEKGRCIEGHLDGVEGREAANSVPHFTVPGKDLLQVILCNLVHICPTCGEVADTPGEHAFRVDFAQWCKANHMCGLALTVGRLITALDHDQDLRVELCNQKV